MYHLYLFAITAIKVGFFAALDAVLTEGLCVCCAVTGECCAVRCCAELCCLLGPGNGQIALT